MTAIEEANEKARLNGAEISDHFSRAFRDKGLTPNLEPGDNVHLPVGSYKVINEPIKNAKGEITGHFEYTNMNVVRTHADGSEENLVMRIGPSFIDRMRRDLADNKFRFNTGEVADEARKCVGFDAFIAKYPGRVVHVEIPAENKFKSYAFGSTEEVDSFVYDLTWAPDQPAVNA